MKPNFKIDFSKRDVIAMVCFTVVMILVLILGNTFGFVSADVGGYEYCLNKTDYESSSIYVDNLYSSNEKWYPRDNFSYSLYYDLPGLDFSSVSNVDSNFDYSKVKYYMIFSKDGISVSAYFFYEQPTIYFYDGQYLCQMPVGYTDNCVYLCNIPYVVYGQGDGLGHNYHFELTSNSSISEVTLGNWRDFYLGNGNSNFLPMYGNNQFLQITNGWNNEFSTIFDAFEHRLDSGHTNYFVNTNYFVGSALPLQGFDNLEGVQDPSGETSSNNLYLNNPYWTFNLPRADKLTTTNGTVTFNAVPTDYQLEHPNQFDLHYWFQIDVTYSYSDSGDGGFSGGGHGFCILNSIQPTKSLGSSTTKSRTGIFKYRYNGSDYALSPFSDFDGSQTFQTITVGTGWNKIFRQCYLSGNTSYNTFYEWWSEYGNGGSYSGVKPTITDAKLKCYVQLYNNTGSSGICAYYYDLLSGETGVLDDSMGVNTNPYDFDTQEEYSNQSSGYGYVVQNNNNNQSVTVNTNVESGEVTDKLEQILGGDDDDEDGGLTDSFKDKAQSNSWLVIMNAIFSFVPNSVWIDLGIFLVTCLGILAAFLILRFLLDLL